MGLRGPKPASDEERAARGMRDRRVPFRIQEAKTTWARRAEVLEERGMRLLTTKTPRLPTLKAALALFEAADAIWIRLHRLGDLASPAPPAPAAGLSLEEYRRRRAPRRDGES